MCAAAAAGMTLPLVPAARAENIADDARSVLKAMTDYWSTRKRLSTPSTLPSR